MTNIKATTVKKEEPTKKTATVWTYCILETEKKKNYMSTLCRKKHTLIELNSSKMIYKHKCSTAEREKAEQVQLLSTNNEDYRVLTCRR